MKKIFLIVGLIFLLGLAYLSTTGRNMQTIGTEIEISASPEKVWDIISDVDKWHEWSPTINASEGKAEIGSTVAITMMSKEAGKDGPKYSPTIIQMDEPSVLNPSRVECFEGFSTLDTFTGAPT